MNDVERTVGAKEAAQILGVHIGHCLIWYAEKSSKP